MNTYKRYRFQSGFFSGLFWQPFRFFSSQH